MRNYLLAVMIITTFYHCKQDQSEQIKEVYQKMKKDPGKPERECRAGKPRACTSVGVRKAFGTWGHKKDYVAARTYLKKGCDGGHAQGCKELGVLYAYGRGVERDYGKARELYRRACKEDIANACHYLGDFYRFGRGVDKNTALAKDWYARACKAGSKYSCKRAE